ncbi:MULTISPECIES: hypothetical protein [unclassified Microbacterium]|uniref:hypothetical protein n=1 Tax=unclassified Microbacterium TaxID=2609290 RepID=UPI003648DDDB
MPVMSHRLPPRGSLVGFIALVLVVLGAIAVAASFFLPAVAHLNGVSIVLYVAGAFVLAAFVLAIIGLTRWGEPKATSMVALVLSVLVAGTCLVSPNILIQRNEAQFLATVRPNVQTDVSDAKLVALG